MKRKMQVLSAPIAVFLLSVYPLAALAEGPAGKAPEFRLKSSEGKEVSLSDYRGKVVVLEWFNKSCPFVAKHYRTNAIQTLQAEATSKGAIWLTIDSTNDDHPDNLDAAKAKVLMSEKGFKGTAFLLDPTGQTGKVYGAKTTPHMYVIDTLGNLVYQGAIDDDPDPNGNPKAAKNYVKKALDEVIGGNPVEMAQTKAYGCTIKYAS